MAPVCHPRQRKSLGQTYQFRGRFSTPWLWVIVPASAPQLPRFIRPCAPVLRRVPPIGPEWGHEIKWDGWRLQIHKAAADVRLYTRRERDVSDRFPAILAAVRRLKARSLILDGELVATGADGRPDFYALRLRRPTALAVVFDLLLLDGIDLRPEPWCRRRMLLRRVMPRKPIEGLHLSDVWDDGAALLRAAADQGLEGIVSKHRHAAYRSGPTDAWVKVKVPGWTESNRRRFKGAI